MAFVNIPYLNNFSSYSRAFIIFFVLLIVLRLLLYIFQKLFIKISSRTKSDLDDILLRKSSGTMNFIALTISFIFALQEIELEQEVKIILFKILYSFLAISIGYLLFYSIDLSLIRVWKKLSKKTDSQINDTIGHLVHEVLRIGLVFRLTMATFLKLVVAMATTLMCLY